MKYMCIVKGPEIPMAKVPPALMQAIGALTAESMERGEFVLAGGLESTASAAAVSIRHGKLVVTDGPFTEAKEVVGGFAIFNYASRDVAIERAKVFMDLHIKHWPGWEGTCEVRLMMEPVEAPR
jgi:hypothetical protein